MALSSAGWWWNAPSRTRMVVRCRGSTTSVVSQSVPWGCTMESSLDAALALQKWLTNSGLPLQKVELRNVGAGGRGLVATKMVYNGDKLVCVPPSLIMTSKSEWTFPEVEKLTKDMNLPDWPLLACYLISEASVGQDSRWYNYIAALPKSPSSILRWTVSDVQKHLAATSVQDKAQTYIKEVEDTFNDLKVRLFSKYPNKFPPEVYTLEAFKWAFGILYSRLVRLPSLGEQLALVPFGDMLNHSTEVSALLDFDSSSKSIACSLDRVYGVNEEVFISYGKRSNGELLISYGFLPQTNPEDYVNLYVALDREDEMYEAKLAALKEHGLSSPQVFPVRLSGWPTQLTSFARLVVSPASKRQDYSKLALQATQKSSNTKQIFDDSEEEIRTHELILSSCENAIAACTGYLQKKNAGVSGGRQALRDDSLSKLAAALCESELTIHYRTQYILRTKLKTLKFGITKGTTSTSSFIDKVGSFLFRN